VKGVLLPSYDFTGAIDDLRLLFRLGIELADRDRLPAWKAGSEFQRPKAGRP